MRGAAGMAARTSSSSSSGVSCDDLKARADGRVDLDGNLVLERSLLGPPRTPRLPPRPGEVGGVVHTLSTYATMGCAEIPLRLTMMGDEFQAPSPSDLSPS